MKRALILTLVIGTAVLGYQFGVANASTERNKNTGHERVENTTVKKAAHEPQPAPATQTANAVCPDPAKPCNHKDKNFDDWELSFKMPARLAAGKTYKSAPFFGLILKSYPQVDDCDGGEFIQAGETERKALQAAHPQRKVFASYECPNLDAVGYDFAGKFDAKREMVIISNFLAIYAGPAKADADNLLSQLKTKYPDAVVKQMTAMYEVVDQ